MFFAKNGILKFSGARTPNRYAVPIAMLEYPAKSKNRYNVYPYMYSMEFKNVISTGILSSQKALIKSAIANL